MNPCNDRHNFLTTGFASVLALNILSACSPALFSTPSAKSSSAGASIFGNPQTVTTNPDGSALGTINSPGTPSSGGGGTETGGGSTGGDTGTGVPPVVTTSGQVCQAINLPGGGVGTTSSSSTSTSSTSTSTSTYGSSSSSSSSSWYPPSPTCTGSLPISYVCSDMRASTYGSVAGATTLQVSLGSSRSESSPAVCTFTSSTLRNTILTTKSFPFSLLEQYCPGLPAATYYIRVSDPAHAQAGTLNYNGKDPQVTKSLVNGLPHWSFPSGQTLNLIADYNRKQKLVLTDSQCDISASPLILRIEPQGEAPQQLVLSSPATGIYFDLLGRNSMPRPHTPVQISWLFDQPQFYFLTLPDANGRANSIDQLFGNDTYGPDNQFASNGYTALAKYDGTSSDGKSQVSCPDGVIDARDAVFSRLRLWRDDDGDGVAQASELYTLDSLGVTSINLFYDPNYLELDAYGNQIRYRSSALTADGRLHAIFDLWFTYHPNTNTN